MNRFESPAPVPRFCLGCLLIVCLVGPDPSWAARTPDPGIEITVYGARWSDNFFGEALVFANDFRNSSLWVLSISRELTVCNASLTLDGEIDVGRHTGAQDHLEYDAALLARWHAFPWDDSLPTTAAFGLGGSFANQRPKIEKKDPKGAERSLLFMTLEWEFAASASHRWKTILRIHHRSDAYELLGEGTGSNFVGFGIRRSFGGPSS